MKEIYEYQQLMNERLEQRGIKCSVTYNNELLTLSFDKGKENLCVINTHPTMDWKKELNLFLMGIAMEYMVKDLLHAQNPPKP